MLENALTHAFLGEEIHGVHFARNVADVGVCPEPQASVGPVAGNSYFDPCIRVVSARALCEVIFFRCNE